MREPDREPYHVKKTHTSKSIAADKPCATWFGPFWFQNIFGDIEPAKQMVKELLQSLKTSAGLMCLFGPDVTELSRGTSGSQIESFDK